jgi:hypothetical protein
LGLCSAQTSLYDMSLLFPSLRKYWRRQTLKYFFYTITVIYNRFQGRFGLQINKQTLMCVHSYVHTSLSSVNPGLRGYLSRFLSRILSGQVVTGSASWYTLKIRTIFLHYSGIIAVLSADLSIV